MDDDLYEYEQDANYKDTITPLQYAERQFNDIYKRDHKLYLNSIAWDTWCKPMDARTLLEQLRQREIDTHPFNKFF